MKILSCGVAVLEGDTHHTKWIEQEGRLDIAVWMIHKYKQWIPVGGVVVDAGAMYGDHTITYAKLVGPQGAVHAFEPHPEAFRCLQYNMRQYPQVTTYACGLGTGKSSNFTMACGPNIGASWIVHAKDGGVPVKALDSEKLQRLDFLKLDIEGFEVQALRGAEKTINKHHPAILCEVNTGALERAGTTRQELFEILALHEYRWEIVDTRQKFDDPQYDIFCLPAESK